MKKVVSLLVAFATAIGVSATAFAAKDDVYDGVGRGARANYGTSGNDVRLAAGEIVLVSDDTKRNIIPPETELEPGTEYTFRVYMSNSNQPNTSIDKADIREITANDLDGGKFRIRSRGSTSLISKAEIVKKGSGPSATYKMNINTKDSWGTKQSDVEYLITAINTGAAATNLTEGNVTFKVGYANMSDDEIDAFGEDDTFTISQDAPVIKKKQFETIAKNYNYKAVPFEDEDGAWAFTGRVSGMGDSNFAYTRDVIPSIVQKFEDQEFEFLTFGAGVNFPTNGEMRIAVDDFTFDYNSRMYVYLYRNGKLTPISATYDSGAEQLVFRTNYLGAFVITNEQITDTTIIEDSNPAKDPDKGDKPSDTENPSTGTNGLSVAVALGLASLAAARVTRRKK